MKSTLRLDPVRLPSQHLAALYLYVDQEISNPRHYIDLLLDIPLARLDGKPARYATENNPFCRVIVDELVPKIHIPIASAFNSSGTSRFDKNTNAAFDLLIDRMFRMMGFTIPDTKTVYKHLETQTYTVGSANLCSFMFFLPGSIKTSAIIRCEKCNTEYDLSKTAFIVGDEELEEMFEKMIVAGKKKRRAADLLMQMEGEIDSELLDRSIRRVKDLHNDPSIRWACGVCRDGDNGYPGSFIFHDFVV